MRNRSFIVIAALALAVLCMGMGASGAADNNAQQVQQQTYVPRTIVDVPWGDKPEEFGLFIGSPDSGARTFTLDSKGNIFIYDQVKGFVKKYDKEGGFKGNIGPVAGGSSIAVGVNGHIFFLRGHNVDEHLKNGTLLKTYEISKDIELIPGYGAGIRFDERNNLYVNEGYSIYELGRVANGNFASLSHEEQRDSKRRGDPSHRKDRRLKTKVKGKRLAVLHILDGEGKVLKEIPMQMQDSFGGVQVLDQDKNNFVYIETERIDRDNYVHLEVRKIDEEGNIVATVEMPNLYYTSTTKKIEADEDGNLYQLLTTPKGVQIIKWSLQ